MGDGEMTDGAAPGATPSSGGDLGNVLKPLRNRDGSGQGQGGSGTEPTLGAVEGI